MEDFGVSKVTLEELQVRRQFTVHGRIERCPTLLHSAAWHWVSDLRLQETTRRPASNLFWVLGVRTMLTRTAGVRHSAAWQACDGDAVNVLLPLLQEYIENENTRLEQEHQFWAKEIIVKIE